MTLPLKILVTGAVGSGKTTLVKTLSEIDVVETDEHTSELIGKSTTTVALDYGQLDVDGRSVHLFGTPGQERFAYMWETLSEGADGMVLLFDATQSDAEERTRVLLDRIHTRSGDLPYVVGVTRTDLANGTTGPDPAASFRDGAHHVTDVDARDADSSRALLDALLSSVPA